MKACGPGENLTLSEADLAACRPVPGEGGRVLRAFCPFHGSDRQRSLRVNLESGRFYCFACGSWGYLEEKRREWWEQKASRRPLEGHRRPQNRTGIGRCIGGEKTGLLEASRGHEQHSGPIPKGVNRLPEFQAALPGSPGEEYLKRRRIPLELAQACGVGYAARGKWPHRGRDWKWGRVVFPHSDPEGRVVNLYGRAVGPDERVPKEIRHDHLPGPKGIFNARALHGDTVFVCEGVFDALSLMAAGYPNAVAIFGVDGLRWTWFRAVRRLVFALDLDERGREAWRQLAWNAVLRGKEVFSLPAEVYAGRKDLNEAWAKMGRLEIGELEPRKVDAPGEASGAKAPSSLVVRWSTDRGWLVVRDAEGREYEVRAQDAPLEWVRIADRNQQDV